MIEHKALELLQQTAVEAAGVKPVAEGRALAVANGIKLHDAERYADGRFRFRGTFETKSLLNFAAYVSARQADTIFVNPENGSAQAFFNLGTREHPGHADDVAELVLAKTKGYEAMLERCDRGMIQRICVEFLDRLAFEFEIVGAE